MRCNNCGKENRDDAKFCSSCDRPLPQKRRRKPWALILVAIAGLAMVVVAISAVIMLWDSGGSTSKVDEDGKYVFKETVLEEIEAATSPDVPEVCEVAENLDDRGFEGYSITSGYDMEGTMLEEEELDPASEDKYPLYNVLPECLA